MFNKKYIITIIQLTSIPISQVVRNLIIVFLMSKFLPISEVGIWGQILAIHSFLYIFINLNLTHAMSRFLPSQRLNIAYTSQVFYGILFVIICNSLGIGLFLMYFSDIFAKFLFTSDKYDFIIPYLVIFIILENVYNVIHSYFRSLQEFYYQAILTLFRTIFELFIIGIGIYYFYKMNKLNIVIIFDLFFVSLFFSIIVGIFFLIKKKFLIVSKLNFSFLKEYLLFAIPQLPANLSHWIINLSDRFFITYFLGLKALGIYFIANRIAMIINFPLSPISTLLYTELSKRYDNNEKLFEKKIIIIYTLFIITFAIIAYIIISNIVPIFIKQNIDQILYITGILIISLVFYNIFSVLNIFDSVKKFSKKIGVVWSIVSIINVVMNMILIPYIGLVGAIYSSLISYIVGIFVRRFWFDK